jgi:transposase
MKTVQSLFEPNNPQTAGYVSAICRFVNDAEQRHVFVADQVTYSYEREDRLAERQVWVYVYEAGYATYKQIAAATTIGLRTIQLWVSRYRATGAAGLVDLPRCGAPRKQTTALLRKIYRLRDQRLTIYEIARLCNLSVSSVEKTLHQRRQAAQNRQLSLPLPNNTVAADDALLQESAASQARPSMVATQSQKVEVDSAGRLDSDVEQINLDQGRITVDGDQLGPLVVPATPQPLVLSSYAGSDTTEAKLALDRSADRLAACAGLLQDAEPLLAPGEKIEWAGAFLATAVVGSDPFLPVAQSLYGNFSAAFYGVRTVMLTLIVMSLLRLKRPQDLRTDDPVKLGRILGLDRAPEVKTLRRKLHAFKRAGHATSFMHQLATLRTQFEDPVSTVLIDGHIHAYSGKAKVGEVYSARCHKVVKGQTDNWVNLPGGCPLFSVASPFNEGLSRILPQVLETTRKVIGNNDLTCVFDRGGYNALLFEQLIDDGYQIVTYRKGAYEAVAVEKLKRESTEINGRVYDFAPYELEAELTVYEVVDRGPGKKTARRDTKRRLKLREIRIQRPNGGQTAILTSLCKEDISALEVASMLFDRTGSQENMFKYMRSEFDLDAMYTYEMEEFNGELNHPNPIYVKLQKKAEKVRARRAKLLACYGEQVLDGDDEQVLKRLKDLRASKAAKQLESLNMRLVELKSLIEQTPARESLSSAGFKRLNSEMKQLMNTVKISAYTIETKLLDMLRPFYANSEKEGRRLIAGALRTSGRLRLEPGRVVICLEPQSSPCRTQAINQLTEQLNHLEVKFPGSHRTITFESTPVAAVGS